MKWKKLMVIICFAVFMMSKAGVTGGTVLAGEIKGEDQVSGGEEAKKEFNVVGDSGIKADKDAASGDTSGQEQPGSDSTTRLIIDNKNLYEDMDKTYSKGYVPKVKNGKAVIILPLLAKDKLKGNKISSTVNLGESENIPFVRKNYEKDIKLKIHKTGKNKKEAECYLVTYTLDLKEDRYNGSYPVVITVTAEDEKGNEIRQDFIVYVNITDGKDTDEKDTNETIDTEEGDTGTEIPQFAPKVMVDSYTFSKKTIQSGDTFTVDITLINTSKIDMVKNMLVTAAQIEQLEMLSKSDSVYVEELGTNKTCLVSYEFRVNAAAPQGQYNIPVTLDYADSKGNSYTAQGTIKVTVEQLVKIEMDPVVLPKEIQIGETVEVQTQVMNLGRGKIYNVRAVVEGDGLNAARTAFIGDIEAGNAMSGSTELTAVGLSGSSLYGKTQGKVTFYYEDEAGNEMSEEQIFETSIMSPLNEKKDEEVLDDTSQWWVIMAVIAGILIAAAGFLFARRLKELKEERQETV